MANQVIKISGNKSVPLTALSSIVYKDVSMISVPNTVVKPSGRGDYYAVLGEEGWPGYEYTEKDGKTWWHELSSILTEQDRSEIELIHNEEGIIDYQRAYDIWLSRNRWKVDNIINVKAVLNALDNIFGWIPGERILDPEFGNKLYWYLYNGITPENVEKIVSEIRGIVIKYEPRAIIDNVIDASDVMDHEDNLVVLDITYHISGLTEVYHKVYTYLKSN